MRATAALPGMLFPRSNYSTNNALKCEVETANLSSHSALFNAVLISKIRRWRMELYRCEVAGGSCFEVPHVIALFSVDPFCEFSCYRFNL